MKCHFVFLLLAVVCFSFYEAHSQEHFDEKSKPYLIDFYTDWCKPCKLMDLNTYSDDSVKNIIASEFYFLKLNAEDEKYKGLVDSFNVIAFPTIVVADANYQLLSKKIGYMEPWELIRFFESSKKTYKELRAQEFETEKEYLLELRSVNRKNIDVFKNYVSNLSSDEMYQVENLYLISGYVESCRDSLFNFLLKGQDMAIFDSEYGVEIKSGFKAAIDHCKEKAVLGKDESLINTVVEIEKSRKNLLNKSETEFIIWEEFFRKTEDSIKYIKLIIARGDELMQKDSLSILKQMESEYNQILSSTNGNVDFSFEDFIKGSLLRNLTSVAYELEFYSQQFLKKEADLTDKKRALCWVEKSLEIKNDPHFNLTAAKLFFAISGNRENPYLKDFSENVDLESEYLDFIEMYSR